VNVDFIFKLALFLIPFDNLFFAPSAGWAAISPMIFFVYLMLNLKQLKFLVFRKYQTKVAFILFVLSYSFLLYFIYGVNFANLADSLISLFLGIGCYMALVIRYVVKKNSITKDLKVLLCGYKVGFIYGLIKVIALKANIGFILAIFKLIEKRYYDRLAFSFTEPSFISIHVFGILLLIFYLNKDKYIKKQTGILILGYSALTLISGGSGRFLVDVTVIFIIYILHKLFSSKINIKKKALSLALIMGFSVVFCNMIITNERVSSLLSQGVYSDPSTASRFFRINASIKGYKEEPIRALFGAGIGNAYKFLQYGYSDALIEYKSSYKTEVINLQYSKENQLFSMPIKLISEVGIVGFTILIIVLFVFTKRHKGNMLALITIMWLYVQFDSLAFYSIWIYLFATKYKVFDLDRRDKL